MNGARLVCRMLSGEVVFMALPDAMVQYAPSLLYRVEKQNAFDPTYTHRREPYHRDEFTVDSPVSPSLYQQVYDFLLLGGAYYLEYTSNAALRQFPVVIQGLPKCPDDLHEYPAVIQLRFVAMYVNTPGVINWMTLMLSDFYETVVTT